MNSLPAYAASRGNLFKWFVEKFSIEFFIRFAGVGGCVRTRNCQKIFDVNNRPSEFFLLSTSLSRSLARGCSSLLTHALFAKFSLLIAHVTEQVERQPADYGRSQVEAVEFRGVCSNKKLQAEASDFMQLRHEDTNKRTHNSEPRLIICMMSAIFWKRWKFITLRNVFPKILKSIKTR